MPDDLVSLFKDQFVTGVMTLLSVIAASFAAYFAWQQHRHQRRRWFVEDARIGPTVLVLVSGGAYSDQGWFHGVWQVTNRAPFPLELISIQAKSPRGLKIGTLDPSTDGGVEGMRVGSSGKLLTISRVVPENHRLNIGSNFLYKLSDTPDKDRGKTIRLRFLLCEVDNPAHHYVRDIEAIIPMQTE
jgi:hypothetical protein